MMNFTFIALMGYQPLHQKNVKGDTTHDLPPRSPAQLSFFGETNQFDPKGIDFRLYTLDFDKFPRPRPSQIIRAR